MTRAAHTLNIVRLGFIGAAVGAGLATLLVLLFQPFATAYVADTSNPFRNGTLRANTFALALVMAGTAFSILYAWQTAPPRPRRWAVVDALVSVALLLAATVVAVVLLNRNAWAPYAYTPWSRRVLDVEVRALPSLAVPPGQRGRLLVRAGELGMDMLITMEDGAARHLDVFSERVINVRPNSNQVMAFGYYLHLFDPAQPTRNTALWFPTPGLGEWRDSRRLISVSLLTWDARGERLLYPREYGDGALTFDVFDMAANTWTAYTVVPSETVPEGPGLEVSSLTGAAWHPSGEHIVVIYSLPGARDGLLQVPYPCTPGCQATPLRVEDTGDYFINPAYSPDGTQLLMQRVSQSAGAPGGRAITVELMNVTTGEVQSPLPDAVTSAHWSPDGDAVVYGNASGRVYLARLADLAAPPECFADGSPVSWAP